MKLPWYRRIFCSHYWNLDELPIVDVVYGKGFSKPTSVSNAARKFTGLMTQ